MCRMPICATLLHRDLELAAQDGQHGFDAVLSEGAKPPDVGTTNASRGGAEGRGLENVGAAPESTVADDGDATLDPCDNLGEGRDGGPARVLGSSTVIRHEETINAMLHGQRRILAGDDPLEQHLHAGALLEPVDELPGRRALLELRRQRPIPDEVGFAAVVAIVDTPAHPGERRPPEVALDAVGRVASGLAHHRLAIAAAEQVHGERDRRCPRAFGALHHLLRERPIGLIM
jgi:hypothetical protein